MVRVFMCLLFLVWPTFVKGQTVHDVQTFEHAGVPREYYMHIPDGLEPNAPLVIVLHGLGGRADKMRYGLHLNRTANTHRFAAVYPQGLPVGRSSAHWNAGFDFSSVDDVGFLVALKRVLVRRHSLNPRRVFVLGISNGGYMAYRLGCRASEEFAGIASVIGTIGGEDWRECLPRRPIPLMHVHGTEDEMIPYGGIDVWYSGWGGQPDVPTVVTSWARRLGASLTPNHTDLARTTHVRYRNPETAKEVWLYRLDGFGHDWPNVRTIGYDMTEEIWRFFEAVP